MLETMGDALGLISQASAALSTSIRQAASWLGHANSQSAPPAKLMQVCCSVVCHSIKTVASHIVLCEERLGVAFRFRLFE